MPRKRPRPEIHPPDLIVQRLAKRAPFVMLRPETPRAYQWVATLATLDGERPPRSDGHPVNLADLNPILRAAVAEGLTLAHKGPQS